MSATSSRPVTTSLDLSRWRHVPAILIVAGAVLAGLSAGTNYKQFCFSWLLAFMFYLSLALGALFLVLMHHLFDAGWSVPIRRCLEHLACLVFPWLAILFLPILLNALCAGPANLLYPWMTSDPHTDHALRAKLPLFTRNGFCAVAAGCFLVWAILTRALRSWSIRQDATGEARCTYRMRFHSAWGVIAFALTLTLASIMWMMALEHQWFSTMHGVYYFAGAAWFALAAIYLITMVLHRTGTLAPVLHEHQFYFIGSLLFAFTVFYAYIHFSQYFVIWNANVPEETFWYLQRERGTWWDIGLVIIFGHFLVPFLALLRIDLKLVSWWMVPVCLWAGLMHYCDLSFNIMPVLHPRNFHLDYADFGCMALMGGLLARAFLKDFAAHAPYPLKDPRLSEAAGFRHPVAAPVNGGATDEPERDPNAADEPA